MVQIKAYLTTRNVEDAKVLDDFQASVRDKVLLHVDGLDKGIEKQLLPNPEFYDFVPEHQPLFSQIDSMKSLKLTEDLLQSLTYNVDEKLAIENFCQSICRKN